MYYIFNKAALSAKTGELQGFLESSYKMFGGGTNIELPSFRLNRHPSRTAQVLGHLVKKRTKIRPGAERVGLTYVFQLGMVSPLQEAASSRELLQEQLLMRRAPKKQEWFMGIRITWLKTFRVMVILNTLSFFSPSVNK